MNQFWIFDFGFSIRRSDCKKIFCLALSIMLFALFPAQAQEQAGKIPKVGFLVPGSASGYATRIEAFRQGLRELGHVEGKTIVVEYRYAEGKPDRYPELAVDLVRLKVDAIVTSAGSATRAAKTATQTIPIIFAAVAVDPVEDGLVSSMARPGGNITGLTILAPELNGKRLELLKEAFPKVTRVIFLWRGSVSQKDPRAREAEATAKILGVRLQSVGVKSADDFESAFAAAKGGGAWALVMTPSPLFITHQAQIVGLAAKNRLPVMYTAVEWVEAGGLMSYGTNALDNFRRAAIFVDKILKGTKPTDLPVEQPMKFEFAVNLKTAKQIGLTIPPEVLARANRLIK